MTGRLARAALWLVLAGLLPGATVRDAIGDRIARTDLPALTVATGVEVLDRDGRMLRAFTVADGRWLLEAGGAGRLAGKLCQIRVALALERRLSKDRILDLCLRWPLMAAISKGFARHR